MQKGTGGNGGFQRLSGGPKRRKAQHQSASSSNLWEFDFASCSYLCSLRSLLFNRLLPFQAEQEDDRCGHGHGDTEKVDPANKRAGQGLNFSKDIGTEETAQV